MADVTVSNRRSLVMGSRRVITAQVDIASDTDTWVTGLKAIEALSVRPESNTAVGATYSGGTITFQTTGAESNALVQVTGF